MLKRITSDNLLAPEGCMFKIRRKQISSTIMYIHSGDFTMILTLNKQKIGALKNFTKFAGKHLTCARASFLKNIYE